MSYEKEGSIKKNDGWISHSRIKLSVPKENNCQYVILYLAKVHIKNEG